MKKNIEYANIFLLRALFFKKLPNCLSLYKEIERELHVEALNISCRNIRIHL